MRIKHAYNTLLNSESRRKYDNGNSGSDYSYSSAQRSQSRNTEDEDPFYGLGNLFKLLAYELYQFSDDFLEFAHQILVSFASNPIYHTKVTYINGSII